MIIFTLLLSFGNPAKDPPVNIFQTSACLAPGGFVKTEYYFKRGEATLPLSHRYCREAFFIERKVAEENGAVRGGTEAPAL